MLISIDRIKKSFTVGCDILVAFSKVIVWLLLTCQIKFMSIFQLFWRTSLFDLLITMDKRLETDNVLDAVLQKMPACDRSNQAKVYYSNQTI